MKAFFQLLTLSIVTLTLVMVVDHGILGAQEQRVNAQIAETDQSDPNDGPAAQPETPLAAGENRPVIVIPEVEYDAGEVAPSSTVSHEFVVKNEGTGNLTINRVVPGCGCSVASFTDFIPPGAEGKVYLSVDIYAEWAGHNVNKSAVVMSNDPVNPDIRVTIRARVKNSENG
ncbi:MAG: DUF1573 domain-containing protein [Deltaproteobacteria bacterium]|jgi:hypothetical protein|nr:DUF1573 domain-containing protein [Deltaproteobacteria bacterium]